MVTKDGCEIITRFPAEELLVAGNRYYTAGGVLPTTREIQSNLNVQGNGNIQTGEAPGSGSMVSRQAPAS